MKESIYDLLLDVQSHGLQLSLPVKRGDSARRLRIRLTESGRSYPIGADCSAVFTAKKPDETVIYNACTIEKNEAVYSLTGQETNTAGVVVCELRLYDSGGKLLTSPSFCLLVEDTVYDDSAVTDSSSEYTALTELVSQAKEVLEEAEQWKTYAVPAYAPNGADYHGEWEGAALTEGTQILLVPQSCNTGPATLQLNSGEAYPLCLRPGWNVSGNELRPQLTLPLEAGMLLRGGEYIFRFDGAAWVLQSYISDPKAEEAKLAAEDAEQAAITAITMGNHVIRASTSDGVSYAAPKSDTLPAIATGTASGHKGKGTRIVLIPSGPNTVESPTLKIGDGEVIPIRLRSAANKGDNDGAPDATDDIPIGALMAGVPYAMTFCGKYWLIDSLIGGIGGGKVYVSDTMPDGLRPGDSWVDTSEELENPVTQGQMETYVADALKTHDTFDGLFSKDFVVIQSVDGDGFVKLSVQGTTDDRNQRLILSSDRNAPRLCGIGDPTEESDAANKKYVDEAAAELTPIDITDTVMEWLANEGLPYLSPPELLLYLANTLYTQYPPGSYVALDGVGRFEIVRVETLGVSIVRVDFSGNKAELSVDEAGAWTGSFTTYISSSDYVCREEAYISNNEFLKYRLGGISEPVDDTDAANKKYVDDAIAAALAAMPIAEEGAY